jgi:putative ABC transport system substrate-binding protein
MLILRAVAIAFLASLAAPHAADTQQTSRVGVLASGGVDETFLQALRALGYVEGQNLVIEARFYRGQINRLPGLAAELVRIPVDVIVAGSTLMTAKAREATQTIPIVMAGAADPVAEGLIASHARPGGNVTGAILETADVTAKRLELLKEAVPGLRRVAAFHADQLRTFSVVDRWLRDSQAAARQLGLALEPVDLPYDLGRWESVFDGVARRGISAAVIIESPVYWNGRVRLAELALKYRLAVMFSFAVQAEAGGLMSYGADVDEVMRRAASFVDRILKGARPGDLPIEQPTRFPFIVNLRTAKALGLTIPPAVLARATQLIE